MDVNLVATKISDSQWKITGTVGDVPVVTPPAPAPAPAPVGVRPWRMVFSENWSSLSVGGQVRYEPEWTSVPPGQISDPGNSRYSTFGVPPNGWAPNGTPAFRAENGVLTCDSFQGAAGQGIALLSQRRFDRSEAISAYASVDLQKDQGAWVGMTLYNGEGNYREVGLAWYGNELKVLVHTPRYVKIVGTVPPGKRTLNLLYSLDLGWLFRVDSTTYYAESLGFNGNKLLADPTLGLFFVNLDVEGTPGTSGYVRAKLGEVTVHQQARS